MTRILVFELAGERFALPAESVLEVVRGLEVRALPGLPAHMVGVARHRGRWLPAIAPGPALGVAGVAGGGAALIARRGRMRYALVVDGVRGIRDADPDQVRDVGTGRVVLDEDGVVTMIQPDALFRHDPPVGWDDEESVMTNVPEAAEPLVVFALGPGEFALEVGQVLEVLPYESPRRVPRAPDFLDGIIELRGAVLPVIDLRRRFELEPAAADEDRRTLVVGLDDERVGLAVDRVSEVLRLPRSARTEPPPFFRGLAAEYLDSIARAGDRLIMVLRIDRVLTSQERIQLRDTDLSPEDADAE
jgi:purine-binding chemotaxis protein CheW